MSNLDQQNDTPDSLDETLDDLADMPQAKPFPAGAHLVNNNIGEAPFYSYGTSFAAPVVTGMFAVVYEGIGAGFSLDRIENMIINSGFNTTDQRAGCVCYGGNIPNAWQVIRQATNINAVRSDTGQVRVLDRPVRLWDTRNGTGIS